MGDHWYALSRSMVQHYTIKLVDCISLYFCVVDFSPLSFTLLFVSFCESVSICLSVNLSPPLSVHLSFFLTHEHTTFPVLKSLSYRSVCLIGKELDLQWALSFLFLFYLLMATLHYCFVLIFYLLWLEVCPVAILFGVSLLILRSWVKQHWPLSEVCIC